MMASSNFMFVAPKATYSANHTGTQVTKGVGGTMLRDPSTPLSPKMLQHASISERADELADEYVQDSDDKLWYSKPSTSHSSKHPKSLQLGESASLRSTFLNTSSVSGSKHLPRPNRQLSPPNMKMVHLKPNHHVDVAGTITSQFQQTADHFCVRPSRTPFL
jgi:hypothetical protein